MWDIVSEFVKTLQSDYNENLVSVILYGSAASGEFIDKHSNFNLLVVLKNADLKTLKSVSVFLSRRSSILLNPLFFTLEFMQNSTDIFPIEFLDMKENYKVLFGMDVLKDLPIDTTNLRLQCEKELKEKIIRLKQAYLREHRDKRILKRQLLKTFTSVLHILRNVLRLRGKQPNYLKQQTIKEIAAEFAIDLATWEKILAAKNKQIKLKNPDLEGLFINFTQDLEKIAATVDTP